MFAHCSAHPHRLLINGNILRKSFDSWPRIRKYSRFRSTSSFNRSWPGPLACPVSFSLASLSWASLYRMLKSHKDKTDSMTAALVQVECRNDETKKSCVGSPLASSMSDFEIFIGLPRPTRTSHKPTEDRILGKLKSFVITASIAPATALEDLDPRPVQSVSVPRRCRIFTATCAALESTLPQIPRRAILG